MSGTVLVTKPRPGVALVTLNRPDKRNAIDPATDRAMAQALAELEGDDEVRCIVITGAGHQAFCAGADIPTLLPLLKANIEAGCDKPDFCGLTHSHPTAKPLLAAINGAALGGGLEIALACDIRIASDNASFGLPEISVGVLAGGGGCTRLPRSLSPALAAEMILTGQTIDATRALGAGLVSRVVDAAALLPQALMLAETIAAKAPLATRACTALLRRPKLAELADALMDERKAFAALILSADAAEGIGAFAERRQPRYTGH